MFTKELRCGAEVSVEEFSELLIPNIKSIAESLPDVSFQADPFFISRKSEIKRIVGTAIDTLPKRERLVVSLYYFDELTMKEIGKVLGVVESRVSRLHTRAKLRLKIRIPKIRP